MLSKGPSIRGFVRPTSNRRYTLESQRRAMQDHGVHVIYEHGKNKADAREFWLRSLRKDDLATVLWLCLLADDIGNADVKRRDLQEVIDDIERRGAVIWELGSGLKSSDKKQRDQMISTAWVGLAKGRIPGQGEKRGRPPTWQDPAEREIIWQEWHSKEHYTNAIAARAASERLGKKVGAAVMYRIVREMRKTRKVSTAWLGGSGRAAGRRDPIWDEHVEQVYFMRYGTSDRVKIGYTKRMNKRLCGLESGTPENLHLLATVTGGRAQETRLHKRFAAYRIRGEWYKLEGKLAEYVAALPKPKKPMR